MLAGFEEALRIGGGYGVQQGMTAIDALLARLIDYAGIYPPASLDMHTAARKYLEYRQSSHAQALGRFVVDLNRFPYLWDAAGEYVNGIHVTAISAHDADWDDLHRLVLKGIPIDSVEIKGAEAAEIGRIAMRIPPGVAIYFEVPMDSAPATLDAIATAGARVKIRTGGIAADAIPSTRALAQMLSDIAARRLIFKATAGLHHPLRGRHALNYSHGSPTAVMHGFVNLACAAALLYFGGDAKDAQLVLEEEWPGAWRMTPEAIIWEENSWNADELREVRQQFFASFGSCSFEEPMRDLEALRWL